MMNKDTSSAIIVTIVNYVTYNIKFAFTNRLKFLGQSKMLSKQVVPRRSRVQTPANFEHYIRKFNGRQEEIPMLLYVIHKDKFYSFVLTLLGCWCMSI